MEGGIRINNRLKSLYGLIVLLAIIGLSININLNRPVCAQAAANTAVDAVTVSIKTNASLLPPRAVKRMTSSIEAVAQQVLLGRSVDEVSQNKEVYESLIKEIFDRVLSGYSVSRVTINPHETAHIDVLITPWNDVVGKITIEMDFGILSPQIIKIIEEDIGDIKEQVDDILIGLPVEATEWAGVMAKSALREYLAERLPEFRPNFDITGGQETVIKISLIPNNHVVRDVNVTTVSKTIPNILIIRLKPEAEEISECVKGLPVAFVERHRDYFIGSLKNKIDDNYFIKKYALAAQPSLIAGTVCEVEIDIETDKYLINIEGYLDIGRDRTQDNTSAMAHVGQMFGTKNKNEVFVEMTVVPSTVSFEFETGLGRKITPKTSLELRYNLSENDARIRLVQEVKPRFTLRVERIPDSRQNAFGLRYRVHEMLSAEYIVTNDERWFRLIGHL